MSECLIWWFLGCCVCNLMTLSAQMEWFYDHWMFAVFLFTISLSLQYIFLFTLILLYSGVLFVVIPLLLPLLLVFDSHFSVHVLCCLFHFISATKYNVTTQLFNWKDDEKKAAVLLTSTVCDYYIARARVKKEYRKLNVTYTHTLNA